MFLQNQVMHQRYQPKEIPAKKLGFQVGPYRMDKRATSLAVHHTKGSKQKQHTRRSVDTKDHNSSAVNQADSSEQTDQWHIIGVFSGDARMNHPFQNKSTLNGPLTQGGGPSRHSGNNSTLDFAATSYRMSSRDRHSTSRGGNGPVKKSKTANQKNIDHQAKQPSRRPGTTAANELYGETMLTDPAAIYQADHEITISKQTSDLNLESFVGSQFIHTSTLTRHPTNTQQEKAHQSTVTMTVDNEDTAKSISQDDIVAQLNKGIAMVQNSSREEYQDEQDLKMTTTHNDALNFEDQKGNDSTADKVDYEIVEQIGQSCLDFDQAASMMVTTSPALLGDGLPINVAIEQTGRSQFQTAEAKMVPVTNYNFREAKQFRKQRSGVENPRARQTYKLPSYANCLRAKIRPKNFTALKQYYELLAKDEQLAKINQKHFFKQIDDGPGHRYGSSQAAYEKTRSFSTEQSVFLQQHHTQAKQLQVGPKRGQYPPREDVVNDEESRGELERRNHFAEGQLHQPRQSQEQSEMEETMEAVFDRQSNQLNLQRSQHYDSSHLQPHRAKSQALSKKSYEPQVTSYRIGAQKLKHQFALKGPTLRAELQNHEASVGTFIKELEGSEQNLSQHPGLFSFKSIAQQKDSRSTAGSPIKHVHELKGGKSHHGSINRFGLQPITNQTVNLSSKLLNDTVKQGKAAQSNQNYNYAPSAATSGPIRHVRERSNKDLPHGMIINANSQEGTEAYQQLESDMINSKPLSVGPDSNGTLVDQDKQGLKGKTAMDVCEADDENLPRQALVNAAQSNIFSNEQLVTSHRKTQEDQQNVQIQLGHKESVKSAEVDGLIVGQMAGAVQPRMFSVNASDKQIEVGFKTNDVFSSQNDDEDLHPIIMSSPELNSGVSAYKNGHMGQFGNSQGNMFQEMQAKVIKYQMPRDFGVHQQPTKDGERLHQTFPSGPGATHYFNSQVVSTVRQQDSVEGSPGKTRLATMRNVVASVQLAQEKELTTGSRYAAAKQGAASGVSEIRRKHLHDIRFRRTHNRKMAKTPDLHVMRPSLIDESHTFEKDTLPVGRDPKTSADRVGVNIQIDGAGRVGALKTFDVQQAHVLTIDGGIDGPQYSTSQMAGNSVYQSGNNSTRPAILVKNNTKASIDESEMLGELQANLGSARGALIPSAVSNSMSPSETRRDYPVGASPYQNMDMRFKGEMANYSQNIVQGLVPSQVVRPQEFPMGRLGSNQAESRLQLKNKGTRIAALQKRRQASTSHAGTRASQRQGAAGRMSQTNHSRMAQMDTSAANKTLGATASLPKSLLQGSQHHQKESASSITVAQQQAMMTQSLNVKQLRPVRPGAAENYYSYLNAKPAAIMRDQDTQVQNPTQIPTEVSVGLNEGGLDDAANEAASGGLQVSWQRLGNSIETSCWSKDGDGCSTVVAYQKELGLGQQPSALASLPLQGVVIPNAQNSASQENLRKGSGDAVGIQGQETVLLSLREPTRIYASALEAQDINSGAYDNHLSPLRSGVSPRRVVDMTQLRNSELSNYSNELVTTAHKGKQGNDVVQTTKNQLSTNRQFDLNIEQYGESSVEDQIIYEKQQKIKIEIGDEPKAPLVAESISPKEADKNLNIKAQGPLEVERAMTAQDQQKSRVSVRGSTDRSGRATNRTPEFLKVLGGSHDLLDSLLPQMDQQQKQKIIAGYIHDTSAEASFNFDQEGRASPGNWYDTKTLDYPTDGNTHTQQRSPLGSTFMGNLKVVDKLPFVKVTARDNSIQAEFQRQMKGYQQDRVEHATKRLSQHNVPIYSEEVQVGMAPSKSSAQHQQVNIIFQNAEQQYNRPRTQQKRASIMASYPVDGDMTLLKGKSNELSFQCHQGFSKTRPKIPKAKKVSKSKVLSQTAVAGLNPSKDKPPSAIKGKRLSQTGQEGTDNRIYRTFDEGKMASILDQQNLNLNSTNKHQQSKKQHVRVGSIHNSAETINLIDSKRGPMHIVTNSTKQSRQDDTQTITKAGDYTSEQQIVGFIGDELSTVHQLNTETQHTKNDDLEINDQRQKAYYEMLPETKTATSPNMVKVHHFDAVDASKSDLSYDKIATEEKGQINSLRKLRTGSEDDYDLSPLIDPQTEMKPQAIPFSKEMESEQESSPSVNYGNNNAINQIYQEITSEGEDVKDLISNPTNVQTDRPLFSPDKEEAIISPVAEQPQQISNPYVVDPKVKPVNKVSNYATAQLKKSAKVHQRHMQNTRQFFPNRSVLHPKVKQIQQKDNQNQGANIRTNRKNQQITEENEYSQDGMESLIPIRLDETCLAGSEQRLDSPTTHGADYQPASSDHSSQKMKQASTGTNNPYDENDKQIVDQVGDYQAERINSMIHDFYMEPVQEFNPDIVVPPSRAQQIPRGVVHSLPNSYAYQPRKTFQVYQNNSNKVQQHKLSSLLQQQQRQLEQLMTKKAADASRISQHDPSQRCRTSEPMIRAVVPHNRSIDSRGSRLRESVLQNRAGNANMSISSGGGSAGYLPQTSKQMSLLNKSKHQRSIDLDGGESLCDLQESLFVKGEYPVATQQKQSMLSTNVDKFISVTQQTGEAADKYRMEQYLNSIKPELVSGNQQIGVRQSIDAGLSTQTDVEDHRLITNGNEGTGQIVHRRVSIKANESSNKEQTKTAQLSGLTTMNPIQQSESLDEYEKTVQQNEKGSRQNFSQKYSQEVKVVQRNSAMQSNAMISSSYDPSLLNQNKSPLAIIDMRSLNSDLTKDGIRSVDQDQAETVAISDQEVPEAYSGVQSQQIKIRAKNFQQIPAKQEQAVVCTQNQATQEEEL